tara:strand:+ start:1902 stop:2261 length:360 start_codon:yes stop_codon:yes gene_type:complete
MSRLAYHIYHINAKEGEADIPDTYEGLDRFSTSSRALSDITGYTHPDAYVLVIVMVDGEPDLWVVDTEHHSDPVAAITKVYDDVEEFFHQILVLKTIKVFHPSCGPCSTWENLGKVTPL